MTSSQYKKDSILITAGQPVTELLLIVKGSVLAVFPGGEFVLEKGDVAGICEAASAIHKVTYTAAEDTTVVAYPFSGMDTLESLFYSNADLASLFGLSAFKQMQNMLRRYGMIEYECNSLYSTCHEDYENYIKLCSGNMVAPRALPLLDSLTPFEGEDPMEGWLVSYYGGIYHMFSSGGASAFAKEPTAAAGLIGKTSLDTMVLLDAYEAMHEYQTYAYSVYMNAELEDLFDLYSSLYFKAGQEAADNTVLKNTISRLVMQLKDVKCIPDGLAASRIEDFNNRESALMKPRQGTDNISEDTAQYLAALAGSADVILSYSEVEHDTAVAFKESLLALRSLEDPGSTDDKASRLRRQLTDLFYTVYEKAFLKSLEDAELPMAVKLFLYFGYADEVLAGPENAAYLYTLADSLAENRSPGVYTLYDWLLAIYRGEKEPSRNKFDEDYSDYVHTLKTGRKISDAQEKLLLKDNRKKVEFELKNMFPMVNKMTYGRISTYCPVFTAQQAIKPLMSCYVSPASVSHALNRIKNLDYSAFYRETIFTNENVPREYIHVEYLPDFILMPNVGTRGVMWQEIEGKRRTTPSRMMLPVFSLEDIDNIVIRLTGEYRWEMCKRIQGARWNDISDSSLTSEYFDYIQFYKKNHDLSPDAKEKIKNSLQKAKNSFKEMFVRDYLLWILFEGAGSPRLNKLARSILFTYCPFCQGVRETLKSNPLYKELLERYDLKTKQRLHHLNILEQKLKNSGIPMPPELELEMEYTKG